MFELTPAVAKFHQTIPHIAGLSSYLLLGLLLVVSSKSVPLLLDTFLSSLAGSLCLRTLGVHLVLECSLTRLLGLGLVDLSTIVSIIKFD